MKNKQTKYLNIIAIFMSTLFIISLILERKILIKNFSPYYLLCATILLCAINISLSISTKEICTNSKKAKLFFKKFSVVVGSLFTCFIILSMDNYLHSQKRYYSISDESLPSNYNLIAYEYSSFRATSGCLCIQVNDFIYKVIPNSNYSTHYGYSAISSGEYSITYNNQNRKATFTYKLGKDSYYATKEFELP